MHESMVCSSVDPMVSHSSSAFLTSFSGVGKSAIGLLSFLNQFAQSRPVVYIPFGKEWVRNSLDSNTRLPDPFLVANYFIKRFFIQNADLIEANPRLFDLFRPLFDGKPADLNTYTALTDALEAGIVPQCGFIIDESQVVFCQMIVSSSSSYHFLVFIVDSFRCLVCSWCLLLRH